MTQTEEQFKERIFENSEFKLLKQLIDLFQDAIQVAPNNFQEGEKQIAKKIPTFSNKNVDPSSNLFFQTNLINNNNKLLKDCEDNEDDYIVEIDDDLDLEKAYSQDEDEEEQFNNRIHNNNDDNDEDDDDNDDEIDFSRNRHSSTGSNVLNQDDLPSKLTSNRKTKSKNSLNNLKSDENENEETNNSKNSSEIAALENFRKLYQNEYKLSDHKFCKYFEKLFSLIVNKRICNENWLTCNSYSHKNVYLTLYCLRILLRNIQFQKQYLIIKGSFNYLAKIFVDYVNQYSTLSYQSIIFAHILDQLLNIITKVVLSETLIATLEQQRNGSGNSSSRIGSSKQANHSNVSSTCKELSKIFFDFNLHISLMHLIDSSNDLCLIHGSLNLLIHISNIDSENKSKISNELDISDQLLLILQDYDEDSKKFASKLLCLLCIEERIKSEVTNLDGIQVLLSLLHNHDNFDILWNIIWCLVQLSSYGDNKKEIRLMGGIPLILSILCDKSLDLQYENQNMGSNNSNTSQSNAKLTNLSNETETNEKRSKGKFQIQAACCALVGELAFNETNSYQIVNTNGVYLIASKLLIQTNSYNTSSNENINSSSNNDSSDLFSKEIERLHCNAWRTLRLLFSAERHRSLIKKLIPFNMFEQFVDIGNFKKDLKLYQPLVDSFYKLNKEDFETMKQQIKFSNQTQTPTNYINDYSVYEIIGSGAFGRVHKVKKKNANYFLAMKEINTYNLSSMKDKSLGEIVNEVTIIRNNLKHPNIVRYLKTFKENDNLYIVMELIDGAPISQHVRTLKEKQEYWSEEKIWNIFIQIVLALKYLHKEKHIVHRDLTSNNIMLSENDKITITDFGLAKLKESDCSKMLSVVGTMLYSCPEIIKNEPYNEKADIWALGCVLYEICCLQPPFFTSNMLALATKITQSDYDHEKLKRQSYTSLIGSVVQNCLIVDPQKRPDIVGVASLIAEKILTYTDSVRYKCNNLEKKLEKEKNKTQKMLCTKQDLNNQQRNHLYQSQNFKSTSNALTQQANNSKSIERDENNFNSANKVEAQQSSSLLTNNLLINDYVPSSLNVTQINSDGSNKITPESSVEENNGKRQTYSIRSRSSSNRSIRSSSIQSKHLTNTELSNVDLKTQPVPILKSTQSNSAVNNQTITSSPNAKLPPIRNPKSKLIMKSIQNKQQQLQQQQISEQKKSENKVQNNSESCLNPSDSSSASNILTAIENDLVNLAASPNNEEKSLEKQQLINSKIQRSCSSSILEKRSNQSKKNRPTSASSNMAPVYKKLRPIEDPILQILDQLHKIIFISQLPPTGKKNFKRKLIDRYKRYLFSNKLSSTQIKFELMKLIKNSTELVDMEMIGLKSYQYSYNSSDSSCNNINNNNSSNINNSTSNVSQNSLAIINNEINLEAFCSSEFDLFLNQNGLTYEQLQSIIEELLNENNYHLDNLKYLREELPSID